MFIEFSMFSNVKDSYASSNNNTAFFKHLFFKSVSLNPIFLALVKFSIALKMKTSLVEQNEPHLVCNEDAIKSIEPPVKIFLLIIEDNKSLTKF